MFKTLEEIRTVMVKMLDEDEHDMGCNGIGGPSAHRSDFNFFIKGILANPEVTIYEDAEYEVPEKWERFFIQK